SSQAQLPHYIFIAFPLAAIVTANFLHTLLYEAKYPKLQKFLYWFHSILFGLLWVALIFLLSWSFPQLPRFIPVVAAIVFGAILYLHFIKNLPLPRLFVVAFCSITGINLFLNTALYPQLLKYQAGSEVGKFISAEMLPKDKVVLYGFSTGRSLNFYGQSIFRNVDSTKQLKKGEILITLPEKLAALDSAGYKYDLLLQGEDYHISTIDLKFMNPKRRAGETKKYVVAKLY
ncbi:MAG TPA: hypothetical protein VF610_06930, partial [Segetibacter sp.]